MKQAASVNQWHLDTSAKRKTLKNNASPNVQARLNRFEEQSRQIAAMRHMSIVETNELGSDIGRIGSNIGMLEREIQHTGKEPGRYLQSDDGNGTGGREFVPDPTLQNLYSELEEKKTRLRQISEKKLPHDFMDRIETDLGSGNKVLNEAELPDWKPQTGESHAQGYMRELARLDHLKSQVEVTWKAPRTKKEMHRTADREIDAVAKPPGLGGHRRGSSHNPRGDRRVGTPMKRIDWPKQNQGAVITPAGGKFLETRDGIAFVLWLFRKEAKKRIHAFIDERYSDEGAISEADKPRIIADLESQIWQQRRVVEEAFLSARKAGFTSLTRPKDTPTEILLGIERFSTKIKNDFEAEFMGEPEVAADLEPAKADEFEGDMESEFG